MSYIEKINEKLKLAQIEGPRSPEWRALRKRWLILHPTCAICGGRKALNAHHKKPVHLWPELELDETNLITLCEAAGDHHLTYGHKGDFKSYNADIDADAEIWNKKFSTRPYTRD